MEFEPQNCYVAWSGGKDSTIVLHLTRLVYPQILVIFNDTKIEYPETYSFIKSISKTWNLNITRTHYWKKTFWDCLKEYGVPKRKVRHKGDARANCCYYLKEVPTIHEIKKRKLKCCFEGSLATESHNRMLWAEKKGSCSFNKKFNIQRVKPIIWWTESEVWQFIRTNNIPYNSLYDKGFDRTGCMPCTCHRYWREKLIKYNPKLYDKVIRYDNVQELFSAKDYK